MPTKRQILDLLTREELLARIDSLGVIVGNRRQKAHLAERLDEKAAAVTELLDGLSRHRLQELCRALDLDDSGRSKRVLMVVLAGPQPEKPPPRKSPPPKAKAAQRGGNGSPTAKKPARAAEQLDLPIAGTGKLTPEALQRHLWSAADILRVHHGQGDGNQSRLRQLCMRRRDSQQIPHAPLPAYAARVGAAHGGEHS